MHLLNAKEEIQSDFDAAYIISVFILVAQMETKKGSWRCVVLAGTGIFFTNLNLTFRFLLLESGLKNSLNKQSNSTPGQNKTAVSHMFQYIYTYEKWVGLNKLYHVLSCLTHWDVNIVPENQSWNSDLFIINWPWDWVTDCEEFLCIFFP